jgi:hypothetical protein
MFDFCPVEGRRIHHVLPSFQKSSIVVVYTENEHSRFAPVWEVMSDPGYYMVMARNILVYKDGLYTFPRYAAGWPDDDDKYNYNNLDLSRLQLPTTLPLAEMKKRWCPPEPESVEQPCNGNSRGRPGGKNGEPIAALTIKLMQTDESTLASYTAEAAGTELQGIYTMLGSPARGIENCRKDAAGVLRQVRGARKLS